MMDNNNGWSKKDTLRWYVLLATLAFLACSMCCLLICIAANVK